MLPKELYRLPLDSVKMLSTCFGVNHGETCTNSVQKWFCALNSAKDAGIVTVQRKSLGELMNDSF